MNKKEYPRCGEKKLNEIKERNNLSRKNDIFLEAYQATHFTDEDIDNIYQEEIKRGENKFAVS